MARLRRVGLWSRRFAAVAAALLTTLGSPGAARASAVVELVREARAHEAAHEDDLAARRYTEALTLDPTCADAYLGLGALRQRLGDPREAERVFSTALSHAPDLREALAGRARVRRALGNLAAADADLEAYVGEADDGGESSALRELAGWYADEGNTVAQLATWRRLLAQTERSQLELSSPARGTAGQALRAEARVTVHALEWIVGTLDPVRAPLVAPQTEWSRERRGFARMAAKR